MEPLELRAILEALIFAADEPVSVELLSEILELQPDEIATTIGELQEEYLKEGRGLRLCQVAGGFRFTTRPDYHPWVKLLFRNQRTVRLSRAALQTLAIIAYRQPVTGPEIEAIRGVDPSSLLRGLLEKRLIKMLGRKDVVGRPILYGTTREFLAQFGLNSLDDLPSLEEFEELLKADLETGEAAEVADLMADEAVADGGMSPDGGDASAAGASEGSPAVAVSAGESTGAPAQPEEVAAAAAAADELSAEEPPIQGAPEDAPRESADDERA